MLGGGRWSQEAVLPPPSSAHATECLGVGGQRPHWSGREQRREEKDLDLLSSQPWGESLGFSISDLALKGLKAD